MRANLRGLRGSSGGEDDDEGGGIVFLMVKALALPVGAFRHGREPSFAPPACPAGRKEQVVLVYHVESSAMRPALLKMKTAYEVFLVRASPAAGARNAPGHAWRMNCLRKLPYSDDLLPAKRFTPNGQAKRRLRLYAHRAMQHGKLDKFL